MLSSFLLLLSTVSSNTISFVCYLPSSFHRVYPFFYYPFSIYFSSFSPPSIHYIHMYYKSPKMLCSTGCMLFGRLCYIQHLSPPSPPPAPALPSNIISVWFDRGWEIFTNKVTIHFILLFFIPLHIWRRKRKKYLRKGLRMVKRKSTEFSDNSHFILLCVFILT